MGGRSAAVWTALFVIIMAAVTFMFSVSSGLAVKSSENRDYGVFIGASGNGDAGMSELYRYKTVVIDAQNFSAEDIREIKNHGVTVYSYMNIGSIEKNRNYYARFSKLVLGSYEGWPDEEWIDVSDERWQKFITDELAPELLISKGADGLFIDNCDVYYYYRNKKIYNGIISILKSVHKSGVPVIINGGDTFTEQYLGDDSTDKEIFEGISQEIDGVSEYDYYTEYCDNMGRYGKKIYILDYTDNIDIRKKIILNYS